MEPRGTTLSLRNIEANIPSFSNSSNSSEDSEPESTKRSAYCMCVTALDLANHILILFTTVFLLFYACQAATEMNLHVALCSVGYVLLMSEAIVVLAGENALTNFLTRRAKTHVHWILQLLGMICTIAGVVIMYKVKTVHFRSTHAILGLASIVIMLLLIVLGYPVFIAGKLRKIVRPVAIKCGHNFLGIACFVIGMASQCYGYKKGWLPYVSSVPNSQNICIVITSLITVLSLRGSLPSLFRQFKSLVT